MKKILGLLLGLALTTLAVVGVQAPASAHFSTADSAALCGGGYSLVWTGNNDALALDVRRNGNSWCAVARKLSAHGTATWMAVKIRPGSATVFNNVDQGNYAHFAGPVYQGGTTCVDVAGASTFGGNTYWLTPDNIGC